jgi:hypothetical protein
MSSSSFTFSIVHRAGHYKVIGKQCHPHWRRAIISAANPNIRSHFGNVAPKNIVVECKRRRSLAPIQTEDEPATVAAGVALDAVVSEVNSTIGLGTNMAAAGELTVTEPKI